MARRRTPKNNGNPHPSGPGKRKRPRPRLLIGGGSPPEDPPPNDPEYPRRGRPSSSIIGLLPKQSRFVDAYCGEANCNATKATELAGYKCSSKASYQALGSTMLTVPAVKAAIQARFSQESASAEEIVRRMTADARLDITPLIEKDGFGDLRMKLTPDALETYGTLIKEIEVDPSTGVITKIRLNDSQAARRDLAKILRLFTDGPTINLFELQSLSDDELLNQLDAARTTLRGPTSDRHVVPVNGKPDLVFHTNGGPSGDEADA